MTVKSVTPYLATLQYSRRRRRLEEWYEADKLLKNNTFTDSLIALSTLLLIALRRPTALLFKEEAPVEC